ncbi:SusC/RagA family TonB-linked outer membrane protein [Pedobacter gandavensis]|uniref:SusC/RagA family TonB-linked outer membrane protein n=1 Tax=Pedobacter gandavensis TaxID=2679963 RepID=A0ABR6ES85_9SPHI|nr:SusC/RagA family TonB-linked outer membrane protein [Pedobacter gandavensis]MBB2148128.1 SusC/RagA family TonB-linked outer membrane protein [Pedobacter gandavensis]
MNFSSNFSCGIKPCVQKLSVCPDMKPNRLSPSLMRLIIMRIQLVFFIVFMAMLQVSASSFAQKININQTNISLEKALKLIRQQSGYDILYDANVIRKPTVVQLNVKNGSLTDALNQCLTGSHFMYQIEENTILIREKSFLEDLKEKISHHFDGTTIYGTVTTIKNDEALAGATIMVKRTKKAVYADAKGIFIIKDVLPTDTLVFSYIGYVTQNVAVGKESTYFMKMVETTNALDAVVVQAYGRTTQRLTTGNIVRVSAADIDRQLVTDPLLALQGMVPGLEISATNGLESSVPKVELRGRSSINSGYSSEPLYIIDGVPLTVLKTKSLSYGVNAQAELSSGLDQSGITAGISPLSTLNPKDIESIEVLKDADATAIYGSRGGNGVILITTKRGQAGKTKLQAGFQQGVQIVATRWDMLNTEQYLAARTEAFKNDGITPTSINSPELLKYDQNRYTDWQEYAWGNTGKWTSFDAGLSGGDSKTNFRISTGLRRTKNITQVSGVNQSLSFSSNLSHKSADQRFKIDFSSQFSAAENNTRNLDNVALLPPNAPEVYDEKGGLNFIPWQTDMSEFTSTKKESKNNMNLLNASLNLGYSLLKNLNFNLSMGYNSTGSNVRLITPLTAYSPKVLASSESSIYTGVTAVKNIIIEPQAEYNTFIGKGKLNVLIGGTLQNNNTNVQNIRASGFESDEMLKSINSAKTYVASERVLQYKYAGVFGRLNYNLENKYILNLNGRRDGSSRFGAGNRFGNFGSIGVAWIASEESWIKNNLPNAISLIKFRGSYGIVGKDNVGDYQYLTQWGTESNGSKLPVYEGVSPMVPQIQPNADFRWQRDEKSEIAMNLSFFKDALSMDAALYSNYSNNQLLAYPIPGYTGFTTVVFNSPAEVKNSGIELSLSARIIDKKNFSWSTRFNFSKNKNVLVGYPNFEQSPYYAEYKIGQSLNNIYVFKNTGVDPQTGEYTYYDYSGDGQIKSVNYAPKGTGDDDRGLAINTNPDFFGGMSHLFRYKDFSLSADFYYAKQKGMLTISPSGNKNMSLYSYENTWHHPGDQAMYAKLTTQNKTTNNYSSASDLVYTDADYIRLRNLQFAYALPANKLKSLGLSALSLNATASNLFVITNYKGMDPATPQFGMIPQARTITLGLNCTF